MTRIHWVRSSSGSCLSLAGTVFGCYNFKFRCSCQDFSSSGGSVAALRGMEHLGSSRHQDSCLGLTQLVDEIGSSFSPGGLRITFGF